MIVPNGVALSTGDEEGTHNAGVAGSSPAPAIVGAEAVTSPRCEHPEGGTGRAAVSKASLSVEAVHTLALASQTSGHARPVRWCLVSDDAKGRLHVRKVVHAPTRSVALAMLGSYPTDWFVTSAASLDTMGAMPVPTRCRCGEFIGESETHCERCRATVRRKGAA